MIFKTSRICIKYMHIYSILYILSFQIIMSYVNEDGYRVAGLTNGGYCTESSNVFMYSNNNVAGYVPVQHMNGGIYAQPTMMNPFSAAMMGSQDQKIYWYTSGPKFYY